MLFAGRFADHRSLGMGRMATIPGSTPAQVAANGAALFALTGVVPWDEVVQGPVAGEHGRDIALYGWATDKPDGNAGLTTGIAWFELTPSHRQAIAR